MNRKDYKTNTDFLMQNPPTDLLDGVFKKISSYNRRVYILRLVSSLMVSTFSAVTIFVLAGSLGKAIVTSGVWEFIKLALSDGSILTQGLGDFSLAIAESLPVWEIFITSIVAVVFVGGVVSAFKNVYQFSHRGNNLIA